MKLPHLLIPGFLIATITFPTEAQITVDGTTNTTLNPIDTGIQIDEGNRAGDNLFHSFRDFSVPTGSEAFFNNAVDVTNIFSRVTGGNISNIDGLIRANGTANLFLLNPSGILFGPNARLSIGGSFYGSTADSILFTDGTEFSALDGQNQPILTINAPIGLNFRDNPTPIQVNGSSLRVLSGESLVLVGGDVNLDGANLVASGGKIELGGLSAAGTLNLVQDLSLSFDENATKADVLLSNASSVSVRNDNGGSIALNAKNLNLTQGSNIVAGIRETENASTPDAQAGDIVMNVANTLSLEGESVISNTVGENGLGNAGNIEIAAKSVELIGSSAIFSNTRGEGKTGNLIIRAEDNILLRDSSFFLQVLENGNGDAGNIEVTTGNLSVVSSNPTGDITSRIFSNTRGVGNAGNIEIETDNIFLDRSVITSINAPGAEGNAGTISINTGSAIFQNRSQLLSGTDGLGNAGNLIINANNDISIDRRTLIVSQVRPRGQGNGGNIEIYAGNSLLVKDFSLISTNTQEGGIGKGGNLTVRADNITLTEGAIFDALTENNNNGGSITVEARTLDVTAGGKIITGTDSGGNAGSITLNITDTIETDGSNVPQAPTGEQFEEQLLNDLETETGLFADSTDNSTGNSGSISINSLGKFTVANDAQVTVDSKGTGNSGNLFIATDSLTLDNRGRLVAETLSSQGEQQLGNITLQIEDTLTLKGDSQISAQAFNNANGGNIDIDARFVIAFPSKPNGSDIIANAEGGNGGNINITAKEIFGLEERVAIPGNGTNDIDASSEFGLDGNITIQTPDEKPIKNIAKLSSDIVEQNISFSQVCSVDARAGRSSFVIKGRGGIPAQAIEPFTVDMILGGEEFADTERRNNELKKVLEAQYPPIATDEGDIYPARGIIIQEDGTITLTAYPVSNNTQRALVATRNCTTKR